MNIINKETVSKFLILNNLQPINIIEEIDLFGNYIWEVEFKEKFDTLKTKFRDDKQKFLYGDKRFLLVGSDYCYEFWSDDENKIDLSAKWQKFVKEIKKQQKIKYDKYEF